MKRSILTATAVIAIIATVVPGTADARRYRQYDRQRDDHGRCLRFNKTTGTVAGAVGGGVLGNVLVGGTGALWPARPSAVWPGTNWRTTAANAADGLPTAPAPGLTLVTGSS